MRNVFKLTVMAAALSLAGCGSFASKPAELAAIEPQSQYDDRLQDALGSQKYTEAQMLYQRRFNDYQNQIDELERKRRDLDARLNARAYEAGVSDAPASDTEAGRIHEYQEASRASQSRVAEAASKLAIQQSLIENRRDKELLEVESKTAHQIASIEATSAKDLSAIEDQITQDIEGRRSLDSAARLEETKRFDEQRFTLAVANAEAERQAKLRFDQESQALEGLRIESAGRLNTLETQISELKRQIAELESQAVKARSTDDLTLRNQQAKVTLAQAEVERLAKLGHELKTSTAGIQAGLSPSGTDYVQAKNSELSRARAEADSRKAQRIADVNAQAARSKTDIIARARTELASLTATTEMAKASVVAPVVTGRSVYSGSSSTTPLVAPAPTPSKPVLPLKPSPAAPVLTINRFEPKTDSTPTAVSNDEIGGAVLAGGRVSAPAAPASVAPLVVAPKTRTVFDVFYVYKDEGSWLKFQEYLKAYGITDFEPTRSNRAGEYFIYCGRYYDKDEAATRVSYLNQTTSTSNVQVRSTQVPI
ncbi:hypothetical protein IYR97_25760 (plasmid) [Pseudomonas fulva]|jgi:hypothetical protein|uniref:SPOR domain-containing protein n=3 Tax=Pseudomonas TaxID=286 RepID=A0AAJ5V436_9PSED|nr:MULTISPECIES: hypothetical protein [Pseudomonas]MCT8162789.1 hypothetical protein [Pseudomonas sp. HD6422]MCT8181442.1 hypothetical protein [Pseudomonas sp. HD6421]MDM1712503.1 hypothetical protein [Pseudomonas sp. 165]ORL52106.1 hypothetical protein B7H18_08760 [Pseudomonas putida]ORL65481.1 hypothetical protein B7H19_22230 [Pseudomonas putida]